MKSRQEHIDFDRNYCTHYAPKPGASLSVDYCALGCGASAMMKKARETSGNPNMAPCIGGHNCADVHAICPKWERRSLEHAEARADSIEASLRRMTIVGPVVGAWRKKEPLGKQEVIECPACKGRLHLSQSSYNGHVHGHCETKGCVSWME
jgi:hypothetical protein